MVSHETEKKMKDLRHSGYSNAEIAEKVGVSYPTVLHKIGKQPKRITSNNIKIGQTIRKQKETLKSNSRTEYQTKAKMISEYNREIILQLDKWARTLMQLPRDMDEIPINLTNISTKERRN